MKQETFCRIRAWVTRWFMWLQIFVVATIVCFALLIGSARILKRFPSLTGVFALFLLTISIVYLDIISPNSAIFPRDADE